MGIQGNENRPHLPSGKKRKEEKKERHLRSSEKKGKKLLRKGRKWREDQFLIFNPGKKKRGKIFEQSLSSRGGKRVKDRTNRQPAFLEGKKEIFHGKNRRGKKEE